MVRLTEQAAFCQCSEGKKATNQKGAVDGLLGHLSANSSIELKKRGARHRFPDGVSIPSQHTMNLRR